MKNFSLSSRLVFFFFLSTCMFLLRRPNGPDKNADKIIVQLERLPRETMKEHNRCIVLHHGDKEEKAMKF